MNKWIRSCSGVNLNSLCTVLVSSIGRVNLILFLFESHITLAILIPYMQSLFKKDFYVESKQALF